MIIAGHGARFDMPGVLALAERLGASFSNHTGIYAGHAIIQVDHDRAQLGKFHSVAVPLHGDVGVTAAAPTIAVAASTARRSSTASPASRPSTQ